MNKVICLTSVHPRFDIRVFLKQCVSLAGYGYNVSMVISDGRGDEFKNGVHIVDVGAKRGGRLPRMTKTVNSIYKKAQDLDGTLYHFHDPELIPIGLKLKKHGKKVIYDVHEDYGEEILNKEWIPRIFRRFVALIFDRYEKRAAVKFDGIVTATPHIRTKFETLNLNTVDINNYPILKDKETVRASETLKRRSVNFVGAINRIRAVSEMISAMEFTDAKLILAGSFTTQEDLELAQSNKWWKKVDYRGQVERSEVNNIYAESAAGLVLYHPGPNHTDSQPNKLFEYMAAGLPVIASNFPLWKEIVERNKCGICVNPLIPSEIADAVNWILENPIEAAIMGRNGIKAVSEKYNWVAEREKLINLYEQILK